MRATTRFLANVKYYTPGAPTGLTGVFTHAAPRTTLLLFYNSTLDKLKKFPEHSVYRQSVEALTKHRLSIVESVKPDGLQSWQDRVRNLVESNPRAFRQIPSISNPSETNFVFKHEYIKGVETGKVDPTPMKKAEPEGPRSIAAKSHQGESFKRANLLETTEVPMIEPEPALTAEQVENIEQQIGAGLIEEIILMAEGEDKLADEMLKNEVWADLVEAPVEGQWDYHEVHADTHVPKTQAK